MTQKGSVLIMVLFFLLISMMVIFIALSTSLLEVRMGQHFKDKGIALQAAEAGLVQASQQLNSTTLSCMSYERNDDFYLTQNKNWWLASGQVCQGTFKDAAVRYAIEKMADYPCLRVSDPNNKNKTLTVQFFRVTAFAMTNNQKAKVLLQATYAQASRRVMICEGQVRVIKSGRQSWADLD